jgi:hypothetical protein
MLEWLSGPRVAPWAVEVAANTVTGTIEAFPADEFRWLPGVYFSRFWKIVGRTPPKHPEAP